MRLDGVQIMRTNERDSKTYVPSKPLSRPLIHSGHSAPKTRASGFDEDVVSSSCLSIGTCERYKLLDSLAIEISVPNMKVVQGKHTPSAILNRHPTPDLQINFGISIPTPWNTAATSHEKGKWLKQTTYD